MSELRLDPQAVFAHHGERTPRYTSYPTAPHFEDGQGELLQVDFIGSLDPREPVSIYLHIPFCDRLCWFCGCHTKQTKRYHPVAAYIDSLIREIEMFRDRVGARLPLSRLHLGGGSPSILSAADFQRLSNVLEESFEILCDAEISVEIDPSDVTDETLQGLRYLGVNRVSIGVQDFDPDVQAAINRPQSFETTAAVIRKVRASGLCAINIDALYGLPRQTPERLAETIRKVIALEPDRIALFGYAHVPWVKTHQRMIEESDLPGANQRFTDALTSARMLAAAGYEVIGIDHFARPGDPLAKAARSGRLHRNFQGYTPDGCETLIGFGASAISRYAGGHVQNIVPTRQYRQSIAEGRLPASRGYRMSVDDLVRATAIERIMCDFALDFSDLDAWFGAASGPAIRNVLIQISLDPFDLAEVENGILRITEAGRPYTRIVASWFDAYLKTGKVRYSVAV